MVLSKNITDLAGKTGDNRLTTQRIDFLQRAGQAVGVMNHHDALLWIDYPNSLAAAGQVILYFGLNFSSRIPG